LNGNDSRAATARPWVTQREAADHLGVDVRTIRNMICDGRLTGYRSGRNVIRLRRADLDAVLQPFGGAA
jgi:excisionase family DNA binding protein